METIKELIDELEKAVKNKDKKMILTCYDIALDMDFENVSGSVFEEYDELVDKANEILYN